MRRFALIIAAFAEATLAMEFTVRWPLPEHTTLYDAAWTGALHVAVGANGVILSSPDGATWTSRNSGTIASFSAVAWSGSRLVAIGKSSNIYLPDNQKNVLLTSLDGISWSPTILPPNAKPNDVVWTGSKFVIVGSGGTLLTSPDGLTWTPHAAPPDAICNSMNSVAWTGSLLVAGGDCGVMFSSPDGENWSEVDYYIGVYNNYVAVAWTGSKIVVANNSLGIIVSTDGTNWQPASSGPRYANSLAWTGNRLVAGGTTTAVSNGTNTAIFTSPDGLTWDTLPVPGVSGLRITRSGSSLFAFGSGGYASQSGDGLTWTSRKPSKALANLNSVIWDGSRFVAVGASGAILTSPDGGAWTERVSGTTGYLRSVTRGSGVLVAVGGKTSTIVDTPGILLTSPDGVTWTARDPKTPQPLLAVASNGTRFSAVGGDRVIVTSADGINWGLSDLSRVEVSRIGDLRYVAASASRFMAVGSSATVLTSPDGIVWTGGRSENSGTNKTMNYAAWAGDKFITLCNGDLCTSSDEGATWTEDTSGTYAVLPRAYQTWNGSTFVSVGAGSLILSASQIPSRPVSVQRSAGTPVKSSGFSLRITNGFVHAELPVAWRSSLTEASLRTVSGLQVLKAAVSKDGRLTMATDRLPRGVYILEFRSGSMRVAQRFTLTR